MNNSITSILSVIVFYLLSLFFFEFFIVNVFLIGALVLYYDFKFWLFILIVPSTSFLLESEFSFSVGSLFLLVVVCILFYKGLNYLFDEVGFLYYVSILTVFWFFRVGFWFVEYQELALNVFDYTILIKNLLLAGIDTLVFVIFRSLLVNYTSIESKIT